VIVALDHAKIYEGPGGPAQMVPMYIAQATGGRFKVVKSLGMIEPKEAVILGFASSRLRAPE
jgi:hypothetical protein